MTAKVPSIQRTISFDANGDLADRTVSVFQITKNASKPLDDSAAQYSLSRRRATILERAGNHSQHPAA